MGDLPTGARTRSDCRTTAGLMALLLIVGLLTTGLATPAAAQTTPPASNGLQTFEPRYAINTTGNIAAIGNTLLTCPATANNCTATRNGTASPPTANNNFNMVMVDVDGNASTFNSSTAELSLPAGAEVLFAGLYWGADVRQGVNATGSAAPNRADAGVVQFRLPGSTAYSTVVADEVMGFDTAYYQGFADITTQVRSSGNGTYGVANVQTGTGQDNYAGWAIQLAYRDRSAPARNLTVFDGYQQISNNNNQTITVSGFQTPRLGPVRTQLGVLAWEGDNAITGDALQLNGNTRSDTNNPANNFFNSSISNLATTFTAKNPNYKDQFAVDVDRVDASGILANNATSATIRLSSTGDVYRPGVVTFVTDLFAPNIEIDKVGEDLNGGQAEPGDIIEYTIRVSNLQPDPMTGIDDALRSVLTDPLPSFTELVPGSIDLVAGANAGAKTEAIDADQVDVTDGVLTVRLGTGANSTDGGTFETNEVNTVRFRVQVQPGIPNNFLIENQASMTYESTAGRTFTQTSQQDVKTVVVESDLSITKTADPADVVLPGEPITWSLAVRNAGPDTEPDVVVTDVLPADVTVTDLPDSCTNDAGTLTCAIGALAPGDVQSLTVTATVDGDAAGPLANTASVTGDNDDTNPGNNATDPVTTAVGAAPTAGDDTASTAGGTPVTIDVLADDDDPDGDNANLQITAVADPAGGSVSVVDGQIVYTPDADFAGADTFTYTITDEQGLSATATVTVTVANTAPIARDDAGAVPEGEDLVLTVLANDTDPNGDPLTVTILNQPALGSAAVNPDGTITYTAPLLGDGDPDIEQTTFSYEVDDGNGGVDTATVTIDITQQPPITAPDSAVTDASTSVMIPVLANDAAPGNTGPLQVIAVDVDPAVGTAIVVDGEVRFTPAPAARGPVTFTYTVRDASGSTLTETVTVDVANGPPVAADDIATVPANTATPIDVLANDTDPNGDPLTVVGIDDVVGGSVTIGADGIPVFTPDPTFVGAGGFTYTVSDAAGGTDVAVVEIDVANAPPLAQDDIATAKAGEPVTIFVLDNDADPNGGPLSVSIVGAVPAGGSARVNPDGSVTVTPPPGFVGDYLVTYQVRDVDGGTDTATITVSVPNVVPDAQDDFETMPAYGPGDPVTVVTIDALANDTDDNGDPLTVTAFDAVGTGGGTVTSGGDGTFDFSPAQDFVGTDTFTYTVSDGRGGTATATVVIEVSAEAPLARDNRFVLPTPAPGSAAAALVGADILSDDVSPNGLTLAITAIGPATGGTVTNNGDGTIDFTPDAAFVGTAEFSYTISDTGGGTDTATVRVVVPNGPPTAAPDMASVAGGGTAAGIRVLDNDADPNGEALTIAGTQGGTGTVTINPDGTLDYTAAPGFKGTDTVTYRVTDPDGGTATSTLSVTVVNTPPTAVADTAATDAGTPVDIPVLANDADANDDPLTVTEVSAPDNGTAAVNPDGTITYTPDATFKGTDVFTYRVTDGDGGSDTAAVTVTVPNADPIATDDTATTLENTPVDIDLTVGDSDPNADPLTYVVGAAPTNGSVTVSATGLATYTPFAGFSGTDSFTYVIDDGDGGLSSATVTITVSDVPPTTSPDTATVASYADGDTPTNVRIPVLDNDTDPAGNGLELLALITDSTTGTAVIDGDEVVYTPAAGFKGTDTFDYQVLDGSGNTATETVTVTVSNAPPTAVDDTASTTEGTPVEITVLGNDLDSNSDTLTVTAVSSPGNGTTTTDGTIVTYTPGPGFKGTDTFTYSISDGDGGTDSATVTVTVDNAVPVIVGGDLAATTPENTPVDIDLTEGVSDPNGDPLSYTVDDAPTGGTVEITDGVATYTPNPGFSGTDTFTYRISDGDGGTVIRTVTVTVTDVPPTAVPDAAQVVGYASGDTPTSVLIDVLDNDQDPAGNGLAVDAVDAAGTAGSAVVIGDEVRYTPPAGFKGTDVFVYTLIDGSGNTDTASVVVTVANAAPIARDDSASTGLNTPVDIAVLVNDTDSNSDTLTIEEVGSPGSGIAVANPDGTITYAPADGFKGTDSFTYVVSDGDGGTDTATVRVTVANAPPSVSGGNLETSTPENTPATIDLTDGVSDPNDDDLTYATGADPSNGTVSITPTGVATYTPDQGFSGTDTFTYLIDDGDGGIITRTVIVTVTDVPPTANGDTAAVGSYGVGDTPTSVLIDVLGNDEDPAGNGLAIDSVDTTGTAGTAEVEADQVRYTPPTGFKGTDTFAYQLVDGSGNSDTATVSVSVANAAPIARPDTATTTLVTPVDIDVLTNDTDSNTDTVTITAVGTPANGTAVIGPDGAVTYTPGEGFKGTDTFTYQISDGDTGTDTGIVTVTVANAVPVVDGEPITTTTPENTDVLVDVTVGATDPNGDPLTFGIGGQPDNGSAVIDGAGIVTYTPDPGFVGTDTFTYTVSDDDGGTTIRTVTVTVTDVPPTAVDDSATVTGRAAGQPVAPSPIAVLDNDLDPAGNGLSLDSLDTAGTVGTAVVSGNQVNYVPAGGFKGTDAFTYTLVDGSGNTATATVTVTVPNAAPIARDDTATTVGGTPVDITVLGNDTDSNTDTLTVTAVTDPTNGSLSDAGDGTITYTPGPGFNGTDSFTYTVSDGDGGTDTATVTISVDNATPIIRGGELGARTPENTPVGIDLTRGVSDPEGAPLTYTTLVEPEAGTVVINPTTGQATYTPDQGFIGFDVFTYQIDDGAGGTASRTVTITVLDVPVVAVDDQASVDGYGAGSPATSVRISVLTNDLDAAGNGLTVQSLRTDSTTGTALIDGDDVVYTPPPGFKGTDTFSYTVVDGSGDEDTATVEVRVFNLAPIARSDTATTTVASPVLIDVLANDTDSNADTLTVAAVGDPAGGTAEIGPDGITYTPAATFKGTDTFSYQVSDGDTGTDTATVSVTVPNAPPVVDGRDPVAVTTPENTAVEVDLADGVTDPNGDPLTFTIDTEPANGTVDLTDGVATYTPDPGYDGDDSFVYVIDDGDGGVITRTVVITVTNVAPVANDDDAAVDSYGPGEPATSVRVDVLGNDDDDAGNGLSLTSVDTTSTSGAVVVDGDDLIYTPPAGFKGTDTLTYVVTDGSGDLSTGTVTITVRNAVPIARDDERSTAPDTPVTINVLGNDTDSNSDTLTIASVSDPAGGTATITADGTVTYTPDASFKGTDTFTYQVDDGEDQASATVTVTVPNAAPVAGNDSATTDENTATAINLAANDSDPNGDPLTWSVVSDPANGTVTISPSGVATYTPNPGFAGTDTFTYQVDDGDGGITTATVTVAVGDVPAVAVPDRRTMDGYAAGQTPTRITIEVLGNDLDPAGNGLTLTSISTSGTRGSPEIVGNTIQYSPAPGFRGVDTFTYRLTDGSGSTATTTVTITVRNLPPRAVGDSVTAEPGQSVRVDVLTNDVDPNGDPLTITIGQVVGGGTARVNGDGTITYSPGPGQGTVRITYTVSDGQGGTSTATLTITIPNRPPTGGDDTITVVSGDPVTIPVLDNDTDPNGDPLTIDPATLGQPSGGTVSVVDGQLVYTPDQDFVGTDTFTYDVVDDDGARTTVTVTVTVEAGPVDPVNPVDPVDPGEPADPGEPGAAIERIAGDTRIQTAVLISQLAYPGQTRWVVVARADNYADALAGATIARQLEAPILLTPTEELSGDTAEEIRRLGATNALILGGEAAVSANAAAQLAGLDQIETVERIGGVNRFDTARLVRDGLAEPDPTTVYITEGENADPLRGWPDALGVSSQAAFTQRPILLVNAERLPQETIDALTASGATDVVIVGGTAAVSSEVEQQIADLGYSIRRIAGTTRYETLSLLYDEGVELGLDQSVLWVATGLNWPDALTTGPVIGALGDTVALVNGQDPAGSPEILDLVAANSGPIETIRIVGGTNAVTEEVEAAIAAAANGDG
ncbi:Ig-like domain-containing protein [Euzebya tangerina]|uniref:Ig-like domain-containing protein n=1 Tax=Euzebya tangerina TaxID=591198 RepID=UPI0013C3136D|nr:Ig-like domain-containing protein [Euzebya tangerina]